MIRPTPAPQPVDGYDTDVASIAASRHTAKAYLEEPLTAAQISALLDLLRLSPSSVNSQPWHFVVATTAEGRDAVAKAGMDGNFSFNSEPVRNSGMVVIFAARNDLGADYLEHLLDTEDRDGRFPTERNKTEMRDIRSYFVDLSRDEHNDIGGWTARQLYWNGGQFLFGAAAMGLDATPMEGIDGPGLDRAFGLADKGFRSLFAVTVGRNDDAEDWNVSLPKSRLPLQEIVTRL
ncbi:MAG: oxygen-insensitive NAD(P)H nitroreductase [Litorimonas sp.]